MSAEEENKSRTAQGMESDAEEREEDDHESEVTLQKEANQEIQTGTTDATHPGINWGSSYTMKRKKRTATKSPTSNSESESKP